MPIKPIVYDVVRVHKDTPWMALMRVRLANGDLITQAGVSSITYQVIRQPAGTTSGSGSVTIAASVFDTLQTDDRWDNDDIGFNFAHTIPASAFDTLGPVRVRYTFNTPSGNFTQVLKGEVISP